MRQEDLADAIGVNINTISRANSGKRLPTDDMLLSIKEKFGMPQSLGWLRGDDLLPRQAPELHHPDVIPLSKKKEGEQQASIVELYAHLIKEVEGVRRDLISEIAAVHDLRQELQALTQRLSHIVGITYPETDTHLPMAAEPTEKPRKTN